MPNRQPQSQIVQSRIILVGLIFVTTFLILMMAVQPFDARALQGDSPLPTDTHTPTFTPVPAETNTPTAIPQPSTLTPTPTGTALPAITPATLTPTLPPSLPEATATATATATPPDVPLPASQPISTTIPLTTTTILTTTGIPPAAPPENTDTLVLLIDTLVLYSAYFFLGCGFIIFIVLVLGFILLHRRAKALQEQNQPPQPPGA